MSDKKAGASRDWILDEGYFPRANGGSRRRPEEFFDEAPEEFEAFWEQLEAVFSQHFASTEKLDYWIVADFFWKRRLSSLNEFWSKNEVLDDLAALRRHLIRIPAILNRLPDAISDELRSAVIRPIVGPVANLGWGAKLSPYSFLGLLPSYKAHRFLVSIEEHVPEILPLLEAATRVANSGSPVGNKGLEAWRTVNACVEVCELLPGQIQVPKHMNNAGPFYRLLSDVFDVMEHPEDPVSAFRGWSRHVGRTVEENP